MSASIRVALVPSLAASLVLVAPEAVIGQTVSARPASVALTVVVRPHAPGVLTMIEDAVVVRRSPSALDVETVVGIANRVASRIEVRLGDAWSSDSIRVLVLGRTGGFESLAGDAKVIAAGAPAPGADARSLLRFRIESKRPVPAGVSVPIEYRVTIGNGDQIAAWTFPALIQADTRH